ncbi:MAG: helix-hairpin-helix domain-containing protein [Actinomycetota bacterium]
MQPEPYDEPQGLGDRLDDLLLRLEAWAVARRAVVASAAALAIAGAVAAALLTGDDRPPVEEAIPLATTAPPEPIDGISPDGASGPEGAAVASAAAEASGSGPAAPAGPATSTGPTSVDAAELVVHVIGAVRRPGLVTVEPGARVDEAVRAAGGPTAAADVDRLNLASPVADGMQIRVPTVDEQIATGAATDEPLIRWPEGVAPSTGPSGGNGPDGATDGRPVDLNRAAETELQTLPGIGPALALAIVEWRAEHGPFVTVDDLEAVPGIGPAKLAGLRDRATV